MSADMGGLPKAPTAKGCRYRWSGLCLVNHGGHECDIRLPHVVHRCYCGELHDPKRSNT